MPSKDPNSYKLSPEQLRWTCDPKSLGVETTAGLPPCKEIIGQQRAIQAIRLGLNIQSHGYNIYVSGLTGSGKTTTIKMLLEQMDSHGETPNDICYVNNFSDYDTPRALVFPAGQGKKFAKEMDKTILSLRKHIPQIYESDRYKHQRKEIVDA